MIDLKNAVKNSLYLGILGLTMFSCKTSEKAEKQDERPNIVLILADDLGFSDLGCYGGEIDTPNLNGLAADGLRFNAFYNTSRCCPSRASILSGQYPHQAGIGRMTMDMGLPGYKGTLDENTVTVAEILKGAGYQTGMTGKWHVSPTNALEREKQLKWLSHQENYGVFSDTTTYPTARGFDKYYGNIWGVVDYFDPFSLVNGKEQVMDLPDDYYHTDAIGDTAVAYIEQFSKVDKPFFLYVAHTAPHWPLQAPEELIEKYKDTYKDGWRKTRQERYQRLIDKGILQGDVAALSDFMFPERTWEDNPNKEWDARAMAVHAAMVDRLDKTVGDLIAELKRTGEYENTVILFLSDNGASSERPSQYGPGFDRAGMTREGEEVHFPTDKNPEYMPGLQTTVSGIGPQWANVANTPFRYWKARVYEGGITSPLIVHWPNGVTEKGAIRPQVAHVIDIMPTLIDLADTKYPETYNGHKVDRIYGKSMLPAIEGKETGDINKVLFWEHFGSAALRKGEWKAVQLDAGSQWELYNLEKDRTETHNLAAEYPEKLNELKREWKKMADSLDVFPRPN